MLRVTYRGAKRIAVLVVGGTLLSFGILLLVLPGPGLPLIFFALTVLATEFLWARLWLRRARVGARLVRRKANRWRRSPPREHP
ncbi:MAG: hypothetical protein EXS08_09015 [Planctomycetes bacterium]|nr:hypothetical protein [Planctomycetota bacterium]